MPGGRWAASLVEHIILVLGKKAAFSTLDPTRFAALFRIISFQSLVIENAPEVDLGARQVEILFNDLILDSDSILCFLLRILFLIGDEALISVLLLISVHSVSQLECIFSKLGSCYEVCASTLDYVSFVGGRSLL